jgi:hypothetical protein
MSPIRKRPTKTSPTPPERDVRDKQDPKHTVDEFLRDLRKASSNRAKPPRPAGSARRA